MSCLPIALRRWLQRSLLLVFSAAVVSLALWNTPFNFVVWLEALRADRQVAAVTAGGPIVPAELPASAPAVQSTARTDALAGTDSSVAHEPSPLSLAGTLPGRNAFEGSAMIGVSRENPQTYVAGAVLVNGARLLEIHEKYVVLERAGRKARLSLQGLQPQDVPRSDDILMVGGSPDIKPAAANRLESLTDYLRPNPVYNGAELRGYEVYAGNEPAAFTRMGLKAGDLIVALNGVPLNEPVQSLGLLSQLLEGVALNATLVRQGRAIHAVLDGSLVRAEAAPPVPPM